MSSAQELVKRGKAALTTAVDGHSHLVVLEDYDGNALKSADFRLGRVAARLPRGPS